MTNAENKIFMANESVSWAIVLAYLLWTNSLPRPARRLRPWRITPSLISMIVFNPSNNFQIFWEERNLFSQKKKRSLIYNDDLNLVSGMKAHKTALLLLSRVNHYQPLGREHRIRNFPKLIALYDLAHSMAIRHPINSSTTTVRRRQ